MRFGIGLVVLGVAAAVLAVWMLHGLAPALLAVGLALVLAGAITCIVRVEL